VESGVGLLGDGRHRGWRSAEASSPSTCQVFEQMHYTVHEGRGKLNRGMNFCNLSVILVYSFVCFLMKGLLFHQE
jgi:hypothetical protein